MQNFNARFFRRRGQRRFAAQAEQVYKSRTRSYRLYIPIVYFFVAVAPVRGVYDEIVFCRRVYVGYNVEIFVYEFFKVERAFGVDVVHVHERVFFKQGVSHAFAESAATEYQNAF